jgi:hypothetical protein
MFEDNGIYQREEPVGNHLLAQAKVLSMERNIQSLSLSFRNSLEKPKGPFHKITSGQFSSFIK